jgi:hypothetical protein
MAQLVTSLNGGDARARRAQVVARHGLRRVDIIVADLMLRTSSQSLVPALKLRAVILVLNF